MADPMTEDELGASVPSPQEPSVAPPITPEDADGTVEPQPVEQPQEQQQQQREEPEEEQEEETGQVPVEAAAQEDREQNIEGSAPESADEAEFDEDEWAGEYSYAKIKFVPVYEMDLDRPSIIVRHLEPGRDCAGAASDPTHTHSAMASVAGCRRYSQGPDHPLQVPYQREHDHWRH